MANISPPDWSGLLREMLATGMTQVQIAAELKLTQASVSELLHGKVKSTEYSRGLRILAAHKAALKRAKAVKALVEVTAQAA